MIKLRLITRILLACSALLMIVTFYVPIWQILMWAPQYPEGLEMKIWLDNITGDYKIISGLNHYIGMKHIEVSMFPEFGYMPSIVASLIGFGLLAALINKRFMLIGYTGLILVAGLAGMLDFYQWGYDYGHNLDPNAPIIVPGMAYQPPLIGTKQLLNFTAFSAPDIGGYVFLVSSLLALGCVVYEIRLKKQEKKISASLGIAAMMTIALTACSVAPEPLAYGKDGCYHCKMTLIDNMFGAEVVTKKGKVFKFDDLNCMTAFLQKGEVNEDAILFRLVTDFGEPGKLIDVANATFVKSEKVRSPMAGNAAAFSDRSLAGKFNAEWGGQILSWRELNSRED